ncbi:amidase [Euzebya tangerina]|uniref:amidase n=1 Tax=Euzebya tangerina TaxID=591198 RepID=UPI000E312CCD|nr:amidase [Euzebya tangerina]
MNLDEYSDHDATALTDLLSAGEVTGQELVACAREAMEQIDGALNVRVRDLADPVEGDPQGVFGGVPFLIKDLVIHAAGVPHAMGSRLLAGDQFVPAVSSELFTRFVAAGLTTIARTATPEFGFNATTEPVASGPTRNPWNTDVSPGGSSGGSAAAVAAGVVPMAHANDGGGSVRIPAARCGLVGLKPSRGRTPLGPEYQQPLFGMGIEFAVTRSTRDAARLLDAVKGPEAMSFVPLRSDERSYTDVVAAPMTGLRVALAPNGFDGEGRIDGELTDEVRRVGRLLEERGHEVEDVGVIPFNGETFHEANRRMWFSFVASGVYGLAAALHIEPDDTMFEACTLRAATSGAALTAPQMEEALLMTAGISNQITGFFAGYDAVVLPPYATVRLPIGELDQNHPEWSGEDFYRELFQRFPCTAPFNMTGQPAIAVPTGMADGLPAGVQIAAAAAREDILLSLCAQLEEQTSWGERTPSVWAGSAASV